MIQWTRELALPILIATAVLASSLYQGLTFRRTLETDSLRLGRVVLSSGDEPHFRTEHNREGSAHLLLDGDRSTFSRMYFPSDHPEGTHVIADLALSHFPGNPPMPRKPIAIRILSGHCDCKDFQDYARPRRVRLAILERRANDPDVENIIPETHVVWERLVDLPDSGEYVIPLSLPIARASRAYPENVFLLIMKLVIVDVYPGKKYFHETAIREIEYIDEDASGNRHVWSAGKE